MLKILQRSLNRKIFGKNNVSHHHLNVYDLQLVGLYIIRINVFGVWKILTKKDPTRKTEKLMQILTFSEWREFKRHKVNIKDQLLRVRLSKPAEVVSALSDPFAADLRHHFPWWWDYISNLHKGSNPSPNLDLFWNEINVVKKGWSNNFCRAQNPITSITSAWK